MNAMTKAVPITIERADPTRSIFSATGAQAIAILAGTIIIIAGVAHAFETETPVTFIRLDPGVDYGVRIGDDGAPIALPIGSDAAVDGATFGGFHYAPSGNASARAGGDGQPAINPHSCWDLYFRPACPDPRGMTRVVLPGGASFWADIYLLGTDHLDHGTSKHGATIADGRDLPQKIGTKTRYKSLDYEVAEEIMEHHGKRLLGAEEFFAAAFGVTERASLDSDPVTAGDVGKNGARFVSRCGLHDVTGSMWQWGTDGDPDSPRASIFGGSWLSGSDAGSRYAFLDYWPGYSVEFLSARGASDHLSPE